MTRLLPILFSNTYTSAPSVVEVLPLSRVKIRWSLPFGTERIEVVIRPRSQVDLFERYRSHYGLRMGIFGRNLFQSAIVMGQVYEIVPSESSLTYICAGTSFRFNDSRDTHFYDPSLTTTEVIQDILLDHVDPVSTDYTNMDETNTLVGGWAPVENDHYDFGRTPTELIPELTDMSDSQYRVWDFWTQPPWAPGTTLKKALPYLKPRDETGTPTWRIFRRDLARQGLSFSRHIWDTVRQVIIHYGTITGSHNGGPNKTYLQDTTKDFIALGVQPGDQVFNATDGCRASVSTVTSSTRLDLSALSGGTDNDFDNGDEYALKLSNPPGEAIATSTIVDNLHSVIYEEFHPEYTEIQAQQLANALLQSRETAVNQASFTISAPFIRHESGAKLPLWSMLQQGGGTIRLEDFFPTISLVSQQITFNLPGLQKWQIVAMDYDSGTNRMRVVPMTHDGRLDMILKRGGLVKTETVGS